MSDTMTEPSSGGEPAASSQPQPDGFRVGKCLSRSFGVFFRNIIPFCILAFFIYVPLSLLGSVAGLAMLSANSILGGIALFVGAIIGVLANFLVSASLTYGTIQDLRGDRRGLVECIKRGFPAIFPVLGVTIIASVAMAVSPIIGFVVASAIDQALVILLFMIPSAVLAIIWAVAVPATVIERPGVFASLARSADLTKGLRLKVFATGLVAVVTVLITGMLVSFLAQLISSAIFSVPNSDLINSIVQLPLTVFSAVLIAVIYHDLRVAKEGVDTDQIAAVFD